MHAWRSATDAAPGQAKIVGINIGLIVQSFATASAVFVCSALSFAAVLTSLGATNEPLAQ